jgi:hypothetical protein
MENERTLVLVMTPTACTAETVSCTKAPDKYGSLENPVYVNKLSTEGSRG